MHVESLFIITRVLFWWIYCTIISWKLSLSWQSCNLLLMWDVTKLNIVTALYTGQNNQNYWVKSEYYRLGFVPSSWTVNMPCQMDDLQVSPAACWCWFVKHATVCPYQISIYSYISSKFVFIEPLCTADVSMSVWHNFFENSL